MKRCNTCNYWRDITTTLPPEADATTSQCWALPPTIQKVKGEVVQLRPATKDNWGCSLHSPRATGKTVQ